MKNEKKINYSQSLKNIKIDFLKKYYIYYYYIYNIMSDPFYFNPSTQQTTGLSQSQADKLYLIKGSGTDTLNSNVNINAGLNINSNLLANSLSITPIELSYLDGTTSNLQTQINNISAGGTSNIGTISTNNQAIANNDTLNVFASKTNTQLINLSTINTNNGITSATNISDSINYLQSQINNLPNGSGSGVSYFLTDTTSTVNNQYKTISNIPANSTNQILTSGTITSTTPQQLMGQFITDTQLNITQIPAGIWDFNFYCNITNNNLTSYLIVEVYKYNGSATLLFTMTGDDINSSTIIPYNINSTQIQYTVATTDYLMIKIYGKTTSAQNVIINIDYNSSNYYSHFHLPSIQRQNHNDLLNIQGGTTNDYQHLTTQQLNNINNPSTITNNGYLTNTDFITFNNKEPAITKNTAFNQNFETLATNIKMNGIQSIGSSTNIARSDHIHPSDTTKENFIIGGTVDQYWRGDKVWSNFQNAGASTSGLLTNTDWNTFNNKANTTLANGSTDGLISATDWTIFNNKAPSTIANSTYTGLLLNSDWTTFNNKQNNIVATTTADYYRGDKTFQPLNKAAVGLSNVVNKDFTQPNNGIIYINGLNGNDLNDGFSLLTAYKTISAALNNAFINSGYSVVIYPATYTENITISSNNLSIVGTNNEIGGIININGNITISSNSTSIRLCSLTFNALTLSGSANLYLKDNNINGNFSKSGGGYLSISNCIFGLTNTILISGVGNCNIMNGCQLGSNFTVSNSGAIVVVMNNQYITNVNITAGVISIFQTVIYGRSTAPAFNCCNVSGGSAIYLNNCDLIDSSTNNPYIINVAANSFYSLRNCTINYAGSTLSGTNLGRISYFDNISSGGGVLVDTTSAQTLTNKTLTDPKLTNNILKTSTNNNITFINSADTIVNLNSAQTLTSKTLTAPILSTNIIKSSTNNNITLPDAVDTLVNLNSNQLLTNKSFSGLILSDDLLKTSLNRVVNIPNSNDTLVNLNSIQTLTNKTLTDCIANTQLTSDNSTKLSTTAYVKNLLASPNSYVNTTQATSPSFSLTTTYQDIASITIPVAGTYELNMEVMGSADTQKSVFIILYNSTTSTEVANSLMTINSINVGVRITANASKLLIIENVAANTVFKLQAKCTSGGTNYIYNDATYGYTYLSYKLLGLTTNVPLNTKFGGYVNISVEPTSSNPYTLVSFNEFSIKWYSGVNPFFSTSSASNINVNISNLYINDSLFLGKTTNTDINSTTGQTSNTQIISSTGLMVGGNARGVSGFFYTLTNFYRYNVFFISAVASPYSAKFWAIVELLN